MGIQHDSSKKEVNRMLQSKLGQSFSAKELTERLKPGIPKPDEPPLPPPVPEPPPYPDPDPSDPGLPHPIH